MPSYIAPYRGRDRGVPPGFIEAASAPGRLLGEGIADFAKSIAGAFEEKQNEAKAEQLQGKAADNLFKALSLKRVEGVDLPDPTVFANLSSRDKAAWASGVTSAIHLAGQAQQMEHNQQTQNWNQARHEEFLRQAQVAKQSEERAAVDRAGMDAFRTSLAAKARMPDGQVGPARPVDSNMVLESLVESGQMLNPQVDNLLGSLARLRDMEGERGYGVPGTVTDLPGGRQFLWQSPRSGTALGGNTTAVSVTTTSPPPGYTIWKGSDGKEKLVKLPEEKLTDAQQRNLDRLAAAKVRLKSLMELKDAGASHYTDSDGQMVASKNPMPAWLGGPASIADAIKRQEQLISNLQMEVDARAGGKPAAEASAPQPAATWEQFQQWKAKGGGK